MSQIEDTSRSQRSCGERGVAFFNRNRFGLSVHWGLYAIEGRGEWVMHNEKIPYEVYRKRMEVFNPLKFNADEWARLMADAGQRFLLITAKHHDGFCLWDSRLTEFKVTNTAFKRDVLAELAVALGRRGIKLAFYYSLLDWTHPAYRHDWPAYVQYYQGQLRELLSNYGAVCGVIFDGYWPRFTFNESNSYFKPGGDWDLSGTYDLIHSLQPDAMVTNNHHILPLKGEDSQVWELDFPGENTTGFNTTQISAAHARAVWWNLNTGWAYAPGNHKVKSAQEIIQALVKSVNCDATFILNVGPTDLGEIHADEQVVLRQIGAWLKTHLKAINADRPTREVKGV